MKRLLSFLILLSFSSFIFGQNCVSDSSYVDTTGIFPPPFHADATPDGGIPISACINTPWQFDFTVAVGETIDPGTGPLPLDSIVLDPAVAISGMPIGFNFSCDPPNCVYVKNSLGCASIFGIATDENSAGDYPLEITAVIFAAGFEIPVTFPNPVLAPGEYVITLEAEGSGTCHVANGTNDVLRSKLSLNAVPNPTAGLAQINVQSFLTGNFDFHVFDLMGNQIKSEAITISEGENYIEFDGTNLPDGIYVYTLSNELGSISNKLIINK